MSHEQMPPVEYTLIFDDGPAGPWQITALFCEERINGSCMGTIDFSTEEFHADPAEFLGASCEIGMQRGGSSPQFIYGIVDGVDFLGHADHHVMLRVHISSAFDLAEQVVHSRIWQDTSVLDIVSEVLDERFADYGRSYRHECLARGKQPRVYCVQYRETDHDFVCRLLEEEGISFYFLHDPDAGHEVLVLCDDNSQYPDAANTDGAMDFPLIVNNSNLVDQESLQDLDWTRRTTTTAVLQRDYDWHTPGDLLTSALSGGADARGRMRRVYVHGDRRFARDDLDERSSDLADALALAGYSAQASSNALGLRVGHRFTTDAHVSDHAPDEYIVVAVRHQGSGTTSAALSGGHDYSSIIECVPAAQTIRPLPVSTKPRTHGPQTATVVGSGEIHTDEFGRIQVQFHWEETPSNAEHASCWIRCAQSWASGGWGAQFIPRVGMEVLVEFLEGNPDRPLVTGCVYNGAHQPPFELPANATQSGWRTNSSPGGGGSNELRFEDASGAEEIYIHGQKDWNVLIENNTSITTGVDETHSIGNDRSETVGNNHSESIGVDKTISVGSNHDETIGAAMSLTVGTDQTISIGANLTETVGASASQTIAANKTTTVGAMMAVTVGAALNTAVGAACTEEVGGLKSVTVGATSSLAVAGSHSVTAASISETASGSMQLSAGTDLVAKGDSKVLVGSGGPLGASAKTKFTIDAGDEFVVKCGSATLSMKKSGDIVLQGKKITVKASSDLVLKGSKIKEN